MTNNEIIANERIIADWMFSRVHDSAIADSDERILDGDLFTNGQGELYLAIPQTQAKRWSPTADITIWHGPGGLLEKIKEKGVRGLFLRALGDDIMPEPVFDNLSAEMQELVWRIRTATPAQLTAALVATITGAGGLTDSEGG